ncbi:MAG: glycine zipper domain-containing protein [Candidatus Omnitrophica bacterium]|nr:glycine zipper domain-containing protein [Candidatus Omnitrophota bacterium]
MKRLTSIVICSVLLLLTTGCQNTQTRAVEGGVIGGILGAGAGYGIGTATGHHGAEGAAIGAVAGALGGALIGGQMNKNKSGQDSAGQAASSANQLSLQQIVDMTKQGVNEVVIIDKISLTNSKFNLTPADIDYLKQQGVSQNIIDAMLAAK